MSNAVAKLSRKDRVFKLIEAYEEELELLRKQLRDAQETEQLAVTRLRQAGLKAQFAETYAGLDPTGIASWCKLLANPLRCSIIQLLLDNPHGLSGVELIAHTGAVQALVSQQLARFKSEGVIQETKVSGTSRKCYTLVDDSPAAYFLARIIELVVSYMPPAYQYSPTPDCDSPEAEVSDVISAKQLGPPSSWTPENLAKLRREPAKGHE